MTHYRIVWIGENVRFPHQICLHRGDWLSIDKDPQAADRIEYFLMHGILYDIETRRF